MPNGSLLAILIGGLLVNNFVLSQFLGICPFLGVSKKLNSAVGMSLAVLFVMLMATAATWPIYTFLLLPLSSSSRLWSSSWKSCSNGTCPRCTRRWGSICR